MSRTFDRDWLIEVSKGNIPGHASFFKVIENPAVGTSFSTLWDLPTSFTWPTSGETWEVLSDNANDNSGGSGAQSLVITGLDTNYDFQSEVITMNGASTVTTVKTDWFRIANIAVILSGSSNYNEGTITLRVSGGGDTRATAIPEMGRSFNGLYTSPAGKSVIILNVKVFTPKGEDTTVKPLIQPFGTNTWLSGGDVPTYQGQVGFDYQSFPLFPEKTDLEWQAKSTNSSIIGSVAMELMEIENDYVNTASAEILSL